ncbi:M23 family metallopeptidase [Cytobacillus oceanisediminis]|uniref:M23 family metallopeptidase n=1 Tax=Cytobacillus oceanisediminis TaxID=665099 RepID=UPI001C220209|nr:M23 family metallopeptidase [Cytobacillus oceanisediminis]MBU8732493.1 M23 family metallopeptidase [Cytobacillus oceanisediminis]
MAEILRMLFVVVFAISSLVMSMNISTYARSTKYLKEDLEIAVHDAALSLDEVSISNGVFAFDKDEAMERFKESLEVNAGLSPGEYTINDFQVFDESNSVFPLNYEPANINFKDTFINPTVVAIIETTTKKYFFGNTKERTIRRVASYSYKVKEIDNINLSDPHIIDDIAANANGLFWPVPFTNNTTSHFDPNRVHPITGEVQPHRGMDIAAAGVMNQPAVSIKAGTVKYAGVLGGYGNIVIVDHGEGFETRYAHLNSVAVSKGQKVNGAQVIGYIGSTGDSTGAHLHFETRINGTAYDPRLFFP